MLIVVLAVVLLLAARRWKTVAPVALEIANPSDLSSGDPGSTSAAPSDSGGSSTASRPSRLGDMKSKTDAHSRDVQDALASSP